MLQIILSLLRSSSVYFATSRNDEVSSEDLKACVSMLTFLSRLIRAAKDKRCFIEFQVINLKLIFKVGYTDHDCLYW